MNTKETLEILAVLRAAYPNLYYRQTEADLDAAVKLWERQFTDIPYQTVNTAIQSLISSRTDTFAPTIGEVKAEINKIENPDAMTPLEAWNIVRKAISRSSYYATEEWEKLPEICKGLITPEAMHEYAISEDYNEGVVSSNFQKSFLIKQKRESENKLLPASVKQLIAQATQKLIENR